MDILREAKKNGNYRTIYKSDATFDQNHSIKMKEMTVKLMRKEKNLFLNLKKQESALLH